jgi:hypothetical protein
MSKRTQIARPQDPNNPITNPNDFFIDEGSEAPPKTKVFVGKVMDRHTIFRFVLHMCISRFL